MEAKDFSEPSQEKHLGQTAAEAKKKIAQILEDRCRDIGRELEDVAYELNMHSSIAAELKKGSLYDKTKKVFAQGYVMSLARILKLNQQELLDLLNVVYQTDKGESGDNSRTFMSDYEKESVRQQRRWSFVKTSIPFVFFAGILAAIVYWKLYLDVSPQQLISDLTIDGNSLNFSYAADEVTVDDNLSFVLIEEIPSELVQSAAPNDFLEFSFAEECWLEVKDSQGREIVWQLYGPGEKLTLRGQAPFEIVVGNVKGTTVKYRGKEIELPINPSDNVARMTVP